MSPSKYAAEYKEGNDIRVPWKLLKKNDMTYSDNQLAVGVQSMEDINADEGNPMDRTPERLASLDENSHTVLPKINAQNLE